MHHQRHLYHNLLHWKGKANRKPLILRGARQVGKTTLVDEFSKKYDHYIKLNLERSEDLKFFTDHDNIKTIVDALFLTNEILFKKADNTLLFIDEIQESPTAISLLRYFYEDMPQLHVVAAGSLLEHVLGDVKNFPVGRVEYLYLHPFNFKEFLQAKGKTQALEQLENVPVRESAHSVIKKLFHEYAILGGMPEIVKTFVADQKVANTRSIYESINSSYRNDVEKYAKNSTQAQVIRHIMDSAAIAVDQRIKFEGFGNSNYRSREVGEAMRSLNDARVIQLLYPTTDTSPPIIPNKKKSPRLQFLDTGLLNYELNIQADMLALQDMNDSYRGAIIPHLITQEVISLNTTRYSQPLFWVRDKKTSSAEVDLVIPFRNLLIPIEIKSGKQGKLKSLHQFMDAVDHPYAVRMYAGKFVIEEHVTPTSKKPYFLMNLPYYLGTMLHEYLTYFIKERKI